MPRLPDPELQAEFYADVPTKRLIAFVIDTLAITLIVAGIVLLTALTGLFILPFLIFSVSFLYRAITIARNAATPGMRMMAIEFRTLDGEQISPPLAFWHTVGFSVSLAMPILQVISIFLMLTSARGQGLTDHMLGTVALHRRAGV